MMRKEIWKSLLFFRKERKQVTHRTIVRFEPEEMENKSIMLRIHSDQVTLNDVYDALEILYPGRLSDRGGIASALAMDEIISWICIDGIRINIEQDLGLEYTTVFPDQKGKGEKYILELIDYFNQNMHLYN